MKYLVVLLIIVSLTSCALFDNKNSWQYNNCYYSTNPKQCEHDKYLRSIKR